MNRTSARKAQGMTEYIIIVGLIVVVMVPAISWFQRALDQSFDVGANRLTTRVTYEIEDAGYQKLTTQDREILELMSKDPNDLTPEEQERVDNHEFR